MNLELRKNVMTAKDENIIYMKRNLVCDGSTYFDTGFAPFSSADIDTDFKITIRLKQVTSPAQNNVVLGCKYEGTISGQQWPGIYFRYKNTTTFDIGGYNYYTPAINDVVGKNLYIWRKSGSYYAQIENNTPVALSVRSATFNQNMIIGCGEQTDGSHFRYSNCIIDYIRIEYLN